MREIKLRYTFQHNETGRIASVIKNLDDEGPYLDYPSNKWTLLGRDQYIGLKDKNNKGIYEGDIVRHPIYHKSLPIAWHDCKYIAGFYATSHLGHHLTNIALTVCEIIGTIHENPELLEEVLDE